MGKVMVKSKTRSMIGVLILVAIFLIAPTNALTAGASKICIAIQCASADTLLRWR